MRIVADKRGWANGPYQEYATAKECENCDYQELGGIHVHKPVKTAVPI